MHQSITKIIKKIIFPLSIILFVLTPFLSLAEEASRIPTIHFFMEAGCSDCAAQKEFIQEELIQEYPDLEVITYEISKKENQQLLREMMEERGIKDYKIMVPTTFIGENYFQGFYKEDKELMRKAIEGENVMEKERGCVIEVPLLGEVCIGNWSLPLLAFVIGSLDGLNVCSIGALILILMIVLAFNSRKKILFYGGLFILTTVLIYGVLVFAWTALFDALAILIEPINIIIGVAAFLGAIYFLKQFIKFLKYGPTCQSSSNKFAMQATEKVQNAFQSERSKTIILASSVIFFAAVITIVELPCSFGFPMVYGSVLANSDLSWVGYLFYIIFYLFFYMLIELVVFIGAVITKEVWITDSKLITWVYLAGTLVLFFLSYYYLIGF